MKKIKAIMLSLLGTFLFLTMFNTIVHAEEGNVGFNIQMLDSNAQHDKKASYFDLRLLPGQKETIKFRLNNTSDAKSSYTIHVNQAYTNSQGFIDYTDADGAKENDVPYRIGDMVTYGKKVIVEAKSSVDVPIEITMPDKPFDGQIAAAIQVLKDQNKSDNQINVDYGYILGLKLTEADTEIKRELKLVNVTPEVSFGQPSVVVTIQNPTMDAYGHLKYVVEIKNKQDNKSTYSKTYDSNMEIAPNSLFKLAINTKDQRLIAGDYTLKLTVTDAKDNKWTFNKDFIISKNQANKINAATIDQGKEDTVRYVFIIIGVLLLIIIMLLIYWKNKKHYNKMQ